MMKFVFAVVILALAASVQSSVIGAGPWGGPWGGHWGGAWAGPAAVAVDHGAWGGPWGGAWGGAWGDHGAWADHGAWGGPGAWGGHPGISLSQGPSHGHAGVYVAKTRGAVHTAPLAGHIASATSVNVAPAPGTH